MRRLILITTVLIAMVPTTAWADATAFVGINRTPSQRAVRGFSGGVGLLVVGFEFEFAQTVEDELKDAPGLKTYMVNGLVQTPVAIGGMQFYATAGGGVYRESLNEETETNVGINVGGGVKANLLGPLRLRLDYRVFTLRGAPRHSNPQRFYAGLNLKF
jgi:opacity protein-like surface antigen